MHIIPSVSTQTLMHMHYVSRGGGGHGYVDQLKKLPSKLCIMKDVLTYSLGNRGNKCTATSVNIFIARNTYEAYFEQIGL